VPRVRSVRRPRHAFVVLAAFCIFAVGWTVDRAPGRGRREAEVLSACRRTASRAI